MALDTLDTRRFTLPFPSRASCGQAPALLDFADEATAGLPVAGSLPSEGALVLLGVLFIMFGMKREMKSAGVGVLVGGGHRPSGVLKQLCCLPQNKNKGTCHHRGSTGKSS